jgi:hypothetical protein
LSYAWIVAGLNAFCEERANMLEFWCAVIFLALVGSSVWLIVALDQMMGAEP